MTYCAAKFYVSVFTEGMAWELKAAHAKMQAKVLAPAATKTEFGIQVRAIINLFILLRHKTVFSIHLDL